ncbi:MAG TPA: flagellar biosynthesis protein FlhA [Planctomycetota bacterium]|nr:flagellar biosynthesis protein FlhA [Planctomycetota bacterium]
MNLDGSPKLLKNADFLLAAGVLGILATLIVPLPTFVLDGALAANLGLGVLILLLSLACRQPLDFSTFPSLLLFTTLGRLALNVASTRLILLDGNAGSVIEAFGRFVVGGDLLVGLVVFLILVVIQFMVITKGAGRISEVAARFTLDAMPGKQMAIDAELGAGHIDEKEARRRRDAVAAEAEFYGAMDGAGKFVRGDALAGLVITAINIVGGVAIGIGKGMPAMDALRTYATLTVGDGLLSQIPALLISIASGFLVTKTKGKHALSRDLAAQFLLSPKSVRTAGGILGLLGLVPGLPTVPFVTLGGAIFAFGGYAARVRPKLDAEAAAGGDAAAGAGAGAGAAASSTPARPGEPPRADASPEALNELLKVDRLGLEVGYRLITLVNSDARGGLLERIANVRRQFASQYGFVVPSIRIRDNLSLEPNAYRVLLGGQEIARGLVYPDHWLAMSPGDASQTPPGVKVKDPTFGLPATWVPSTRKSEAEGLGCTVVDAESVLVTHLTETLKEHAHEILSRDDVQKLVERAKESAPAVVAELTPETAPLGLVQTVLQNLLRERVAIRNLPAILETVADHARRTKDPEAVSEAVRQRLARLLVETYAAPGGVLQALTLDPTYEQQLADALAGSVDPRVQAALAPKTLQALQDAAAEQWRKAQAKGKDPVILVRGPVRRYLADLFRALTPRIPVLSFNEAVAARSLDACGQISPKEEPARSAPPPAPRPAPRVATATA